MHAVRDS